MLNGAPPTVSKVSKSYQSGELSVTALIDGAMARIERLNPVYRAFSYLSDDIRAQASSLQRDLERGRLRGPLHGLAVSVKGCIPVAGMPWTEGSGVFAQRIADRDARIVQQLRAAGGVIIGTTTLSEMVMYGVVNHFEPMGENPWDKSRTAGGSSTGAGVAAALGFSQINVGTDSGGSVRNPACHCGMVGFMPGIDILSHEGIINRAPSVSAVGLIARTVADVEIAFRTLTDVNGAAKPRRRLLVMRKLIEKACDEETLSLFSNALDRLSGAGFQCIDVELSAWQEGQEAAGFLSMFESGVALAHMDLSHAGEGIRARAASAAKLTQADVDAAHAATAALRRQIQETLEAQDADAVASPTWPFPAPPITAEEMLVQGKRVPLDPVRHTFVRAANAINGCAITVPMGIYPLAGVPAGLHLTSYRGTETRLLATAQLIEAVLPPMPLAPPLREYRAES